LESTRPPDHRIRAEIDLDQRFIGEDYAVPNREKHRGDPRARPGRGSFVGPVYPGKSFAGMLDQVRAGRVQPGSNIAFLHTGDVGNLFEIPEVVGNVARA
jgi:1-aminocyclopropane-1-carboxylate deaminase/D-cysteine desulfhydrase-like pyridoxal-dependent ACC family enzyme